MTGELDRAALEAAMQNDELVLVYQPKVRLSSGQVVGAEALLRWSGVSEELIPPDRFLPLAEESGLLHDITVNLLDQAARACVHLRRPTRELAISMNVAPGDLASSTISDRIGHLLQMGIITREELQIEITESAVMSNVERVRGDLDRLKALGITILMDDFGTGYSSVDRLSQLPFSALKLDKGVVQRMGTSRQNLDVVRASISMARELGMTSVAEGVESAAAYDFLIVNGCEEAQGYWIGRPMPLEDFARWLDSGQRFGGSQIGRIHQGVLNLMQFRKSLVDAAFCHRLDPATALPSVIRPGLGDSVEHSRMGQWYFTVDRELAEHAGYRELHAPLVDVHAAGLQLLTLIETGAGARDLDQALADVDRCFDPLLRRLHTLERELLSTLA